MHHQPDAAAFFSVYRHSHCTAWYCLSSVYINGQPAPKIPMIGIHIIKVEIGEVVDIILNNRYV